MGTVIGYARTASRLHGQAQKTANLAKQRAALLAAGCENVFEESCSGTLPLADRTGLTEVLGNLQTSDMFMVCDVARLRRSFMGLVMVVSVLQQRGIKLYIRDRPSEFTNLDQMLDQASHCFDTLEDLLW